MQVIIKIVLVEYQGIKKFNIDNLMFTILFSFEELNFNRGVLFK